MGEPSATLLPLARTPSWSVSISPHLSVPSKPTCLTVLSATFPSQSSGTQPACKLLLLLMVIQHFFVCFTEAQELPAVLLVQKPCHKDDKSYCMNGICTYQDDQDQSMKHRICHAGYTGDRCQHMTLTSHTTEDSERYIAIVIGSGFLLIALAGVLFYFIHYRALKTQGSQITTPFKHY
uniref:EGF-like domain-containing protein n=1 Tax=Callorhinchus milii TaxID=7868 RepID=A0A4W3K888_CALMI